MFKSVNRSIYIAVSLVAISACAPDLVVGTGASSTSSGGAGTGGIDASSSANSSGVGGASSSSSSSSSSGNSDGTLGSPCAQTPDCTAGLTCEDGVCCSETCGECRSCNQTGSLGKCVGVPAGTDDCAVNGQLCDKVGQCSCGVSLPTTGDGTCPADPKWSNLDNACTYKCGGIDECKAQPDVICAAGSDCIIECTGDGACEGTRFFCPSGHACTLKCTNTNSCKNTILICSDDGPCNIECAGSISCGGAELRCGNNACTATCVGGSSRPTLSQNPNTSSCLTAPCP
jgi:hypothetical protein